MAVKWLLTYNHKDPSWRTTTHGILCYIYQRDVVESKIKRSADFLMNLYYQVVPGPARIMIIGALQSMMKNGRILDALCLLKTMATLLEIELRIKMSLRYYMLTKNLRMKFFAYSYNASNSYCHIASFNWPETNTKCMN